MQSAARNGVGTWIGIASAAAAFAAWILGQLGAIEWDLGWPQVIAGLVAIAPLLMVQWGKFRQAVEEIRNGGDTTATIVVEAPEPDLDIPEGEPELAG